MSDNHAGKVSRHYRTFRRIDRACRKIKQRLASHRLLVTESWWYILLLVIVPLLYLTVELVNRTHTTYYLLTGPKGGTSNVVGPRMAEVLNQTTPLEHVLHLNVVPDYTVEESCGSLDNLYYLNRGLAHLGFVHDGLPIESNYEPKCPLPLKEPRFKDKHMEMRTRAVFPLFTAPLHIVARRELKISDLEDLRPTMKVYLGSEGSATAFVARNILARSGLTVTHTGMHLNYDKSIEQMLDGRIDVGFFLTGLNARVVQQLMQTGRFTLLSISHAPGLQMHFPYLHPVIIPGGTYEGAGKEVLTIGATTILAASSELNDVEVYTVATKLSQHLHDLIRDVPMNAVKAVETDPSKDLYYPLHEGAVRFFDHDPPFFLDPKTMAGIGTYLSLVYAAYGFSSQYLRKYRVQRVLEAVDRALKCHGIAASKPDHQRSHTHLRRVLRPALQALRHHSISYEDFQRITEYVKGHS